MLFQIHECPNPACRFRFPAEAAQSPGRCPRCGGPIHPTGAPFPAGDVTAPGKPAPGPPTVALLDNIRSIFNVGAMFRIADGAGLLHLHLAGITATPDHPKVAKTALGAETAVPWTYHPNGVQAGRDLQTAGYRLWALEGGADALSLFATPRPEQPIALIAGNEKAGVDPGLLQLCTRVIYIPMYGRKRSLNVAVAFGIAAYYLQDWPS